ncbi:MULTISPECIES: radical SAM protein [unclassified Dehalobacter]|jgi:Predicted Fe-S oxidoreductases|uniref:radical SAM protein n=1 Tax=unclassified Dehalobacter TaxID=2635733 RepID=UPI00028A68E3|nr:MULTISPECIES: radical SAM protein [unclassified Dehalobacter]AFV01156.1 Radical SAM domain protein [Dehalobacter sp. DCA]AFV04199.1 Radical SAM domain protein [Dehalobacter sp. CF]
MGCGCGCSSGDSKPREVSLKTEKQTDQDGSLHLPAEVMEKLRVTPGSKVLISASSNGLLLRSTNPELSKLYIEPTNTCNLSCRTCIRHTWKDSEGFMSREVYLKLLAEASEFKSLRKISFWGFGEPLLHPDIVEMVAQAKQLGVETQIITNGLLLDKKMAEGLMQAGLDSIVVSIDGTSEEVQADIRSGADLNAIKKNVKYLRLIRERKSQMNPEIGIEFVVTRSNVKELGNLKILANELGASFIFISNLLPYSSEMKDDILYLDSVRMGTGENDNPRIYFPPIDNRRDEGENIIKVSGPLDLSHTTLKKGDGYCRFVDEGTLVVSWDGEVSPCVALMRSYSCYVLDRKKDIKKYTVGNVAKDTIKDLWEKPDFVSFRERVQRFDFAPCTCCGGCDMSESNEEDCYGDTFPVCGDCLWAQGVIQCP